MTKNRRIILNVIATYSRSLYGIVIGVFCGRWSLMALGEVDYGLIGLVAGMTAFITFLNGVLAGSVARFFAVAVGESNVKGAVGLEKCRMWFTTAVMVHSVLPFILMIIGYPLGVWAVRSFLTIPPDRIEVCVWVWRFVCASCLLSMFSVPFNAIYTAKQYIAELTVYSVVTTTLNTLFLYYMIKHPGDWLSRYAFWQCMLAITPQLIIAIRAVYLFPECRFMRKYMFCWRNFGKLGSYAGWNLFGGLGLLFREQGVSILVNKYFGPRMNAGQAVGSTVSGHANSLAGCMVGAFSPAIFNEWGAGNHDGAKKLAIQTCKFGTLLIMVFATPLLIEIQEVLTLWLRTPPMHAGLFCCAILLSNLIDRTTVGHMVILNANGKVASYQICLGSLHILTLPIAWLGLELGFGVWAIIGSMLLTTTGVAVGRVWFAQLLTSMDMGRWFMRVFMPLLCVAMLSMCIGYIPSLIMDASFVRVLVTTAFVEIVFLPSVWLWVLDEDERNYLKRVIGPKYRFIKELLSCR